MTRHDFYVGQHVRLRHAYTVVQPGGPYKLDAGRSGGVTAISTSRVKVFFPSWDQVEVWIPVASLAPVEVPA